MWCIAFYFSNAGLSTMKTKYEEEQTKQWSKDTKGLIRIRKSKNRQHNDQSKKGQKDKQ
jgi:hypothetical protein